MTEHAINLVRSDIVRSTEELAKEIRDSQSIDNLLLFAEARTAYIMRQLRALQEMKKLKLEV